jgi:hypothetical protein
MSKEEKKMEAVVTKLGKLDAKRPQYITGRQAYVKDLVAVSSHCKAIGRDVDNHMSKK